MKATKIKLLVHEYQSRLIIRAPYEKHGQLYFRRTDTSKEILYLEASCDELRHGLTNYEQLLDEVKARNFDRPSVKEAIIYALQAQATKQVFHAQKQWIKEYYTSLIEKAKKGQGSRKNKQFKQPHKALQQKIKQLSAELKRKNELIETFQQKVNEYVKRCEQHEDDMIQKNFLIAKLKQRNEEDIAQKNSRIAKLEKHNKSLSVYQSRYDKASKKNKQMEREIKQLNEKIKTLARKIQAQSNSRKR